MNSIKHKQILDALMTRPIKALEDEVKYLLFLVKCGHLEGDQVVSQLAKRWRKIFDADEAVCHINYSRQINLALATILHQYGLCDEALAQKAIECIDALNKDVVIDGTFYKKSTAIKTLLLSPPEKIKKLPAGIGNADSFTFLREKDLCAIRFDDLWFTFYVDKVAGFNEVPIITFYDLVFDKKPAPEEVIGGAAPTCFCSGVSVERHRVYDLSYLPDPAGQYELLASNWEHKPDDSHIKSTREGLGVVTRLLNLERTVNEIIERNKKR